MAKFVYRMQNILNLNEKLEEQAKMDYATQQAVLNEAEEAEEALKKRKEQYEEKARRIRSDDSVKVRDLIENSQAIEIMGGMIEEQHEVVKKEESILEVKRQALEDAMKERKTQEKLKEKAFDEFKAELLMEESKQIDQLTSYTFGIKKQKSDN
ncbi:MAG: flagellar export protein FliJ [Lachnospiraceae bacterium]|nr:flagellar export protein FliJ [Lachnospiraceae bacterium]